ncbi:MULTISPECIES: hypothetical protein, partial [unclassified Bartonella]|uniref:hypothetical protein n=1 Tax=unclassified Bartonella TaxID=2645622 RepID=UPI0035CFC150
NCEIDDIKPSTIELARSSPACSIPALALSESFSRAKKLFLNWNFLKSPFYTSLKAKIKLPKHVRVI